MAFAVPLLSRTLRLSPLQPLVRAASARGAGPPRRGAPPASPTGWVSAPPRGTWHD